MQASASFADLFIWFSAAIHHLHVIPIGSRLPRWTPDPQPPLPNSRARYLISYSDIVLQFVASFLANWHSDRVIARSGMKKSARQDATAGQRNSLNTDRTKKAPQRRDVLASLRATQIVASKPALPAGRTYCEPSRRALLIQNRAYRCHSRLSPRADFDKMCSGFATIAGDGVR